MLVSCSEESNEEPEGPPPNTTITITGATISSGIAGNSLTLGESRTFKIIAKYNNGTDYTGPVTFDVEIYSGTMPASNTLFLPSLTVNADEYVTFTAPANTAVIYITATIGSSAPVRLFTGLNGGRININ